MNFEPRVAVTKSTPDLEVGTGVSSGEAGAGRALGAAAATEALSAIRTHRPAAVLVFASVRYDLAEVIAGVADVAGAAPILGASTAGEICRREHRDSIVVAVLASPYLRVRTGLGREVSRGWQRALDEALAAPDLAPLFDGSPTAWAELGSSGRSAFGLLFSPGNTRRAVSSSFEILETLKRRSLGQLPLFGGSAADDWRMEGNFVLTRDGAHADALLVAVFDTELQWGIGLDHGLSPAGRSTTVTGVEGHEVVTLDGRPAIEVYAEVLGTTPQALAGVHLTLGARRVLGTADALGAYIPNVASYATGRGGILLTRSVAPGTVLTPLAESPQTTSSAGPEALRKARLRGGISHPALALTAYCALRPKLLGEASRYEVPRMQATLGDAPLVGFASFGEQALADDGSPQHTNAVIAALVLGAELSPAARAAREQRVLRAEADALRRRNELELEGLVARRTAELRATNAQLALEIEQRRSAEAAARRHERAARALGACIGAQVRAKDERQLVEDVCRIVVEVGGYRLCWVGMREDDAARTVRPAASWGADDGYVASANVSWADNERGRGPIGTAIRTGQPAIARHTQEDPAFGPWREEAARRGFKSLLALPLVTDGTVLGAIAIYAGDVAALRDPEEVRLLEELAGELSFAIAALRGRAERGAMMSRLVEADRLASVGTLAAGVAHEINNPLAYLLGGLDYVELQFAAGPAGVAAVLGELKSVLGEMRTGGERIREIVRDLKTIARDRDGAREAIDPRKVLDASINMVGSEFKQRRVTVRRDYGPGSWVLATEARLGQVFVNLLVNAAHAFDEVSDRPRELVARTRTDVEGRVVLEISDTGSGIPPEHLGRIFEPFFTTKPVGVGTGLGLWISHNLVASLGGTIEVESQVNAGTTFRVLLPRAENELSAAPPARGPDRVPRGRVLVVDDDDLVGQAIRRALEPEHDVVVETCPRKALDRLTGDDVFGVVLCDLMMPGLTGMDLHALLAAERPREAARLVFITGGAFTSEARAYVERSGNPCLEKPFLTEDLLAIVRRVMAGASSP